jgi:hypothetical protein
METMLYILRTSSMSQVQGLALGLFLLFFIFLTICIDRVKAGRSISLRSIPAFAALGELMDRAVESGRSLHISLGVKGIGGKDTATTLAGLTMLEHMADQGAAGDVQPMVTVADPTLLPLAQDVLRRAYSRRGRAERYDPTRVRLVAPEPTAYATGVMDVLEHEELAGNVLVGAFGDEYLLMGETAARKGLSQIAGAADPQALPFIFTTADETLVGEEIYAASAYLYSLPEHIGSLLAQDWMRALIALIILIGVILKSLY